MVEHPLFCVLVLFTLQILFVLLSSIPPVKKKVSAPLKIVVLIFIIVIVSILQAVLVEPNVSVDKAMHTFEGKLPDLIILEGEEPVDALLKWGKEAAKDHHPIVRENIYWELLDELCNRTETLNGTVSFDSWSRETAEAHIAIDTFAKIKDPEAREWNDKPCTPYFGGALCAKYDKDGNMMIEV